MGPVGYGEECDSLLHNCRRARRAGVVEPVGSGELLEQVKAQVRDARVQAARAVNTEVIALYGRIGRLIRDRQAEQGWGTKVSARLTDDLRTEFPGMRGLSELNATCGTCAPFAAAVGEPIGQQPAAQLPWAHVMVLLDRVSDHHARTWYAAQAVAHGWSRATLTHHIVTDRHARVGAGPSTFAAVLPPAESDLVREIVADPYDLDFLALDPGYTERDLEDALIARLTHFLTELGAGFAFVGRQHRLVVSGQDYFVDLLFFHLGCAGSWCSNSKPGAPNPSTWASSTSTSTSSMTSSAVPSTATGPPSGSCSPPIATTWW